jgi:hypothetical protein
VRMKAVGVYSPSPLGSVLSLVRLDNHEFRVAPLT